MKKLFTLSLVALVLLTGCSKTTSTNVSEPNEVVVDFGNKQVTKGELYHMMLLNSPVTPVETLLKKILFEQEVPLTEEDTTAAREEFQEMKDFYDSVFGEGYFESYIKSWNSEKTEEDYFQEVYLLSYQQNKLTKKYLKETFEKQMTVYYPTKVQIIEVSDTVDVANEILTAIQNGATFEEAIAERTTASYRWVDQVITSTFDTSLPINLFNAISTQNASGLIGEPILNESTGVYYIVNVVEVNPSEMKEDVIDYLSNQTTISTEALTHYITKNHFKIYDLDIYEAFESEKPEYLK